GQQAGVAGDPCPPFYDPFWDPFWAACQDLELVLHIHAGFGHAQGEFGAFTVKVNEIARDQGSEATAEAFDTTLETTLERRPVWQRICGGVVDRSPRLKVALRGIHCDWVPATLALLDDVHARSDPLAELKPSEYWGRNFWVGASIMRHTDVAARHAVGVD